MFTYEVELDNTVKKISLALGDGADAEFHGFLHGAYITGVNKARAVLEELAEEKQASEELSKKKLDEENMAAAEPIIA